MKPTKYTYNDYKNMLDIYKNILNMNILYNLRMEDNGIFKRNYNLYLASKFIDILKNYKPSIYIKCDIKKGTNALIVNGLSKLEYYEYDGSIVKSDGIFPEDTLCYIRNNGVYFNNSSLCDAIAEIVIYDNTLSIEESFHLKNIINDLLRTNLQHSMYIYFEGHSPIGIYPFQVGVTQIGSSYINN
jgi:hypothetical protein